MSNIDITMRLNGTAEVNKGLSQTSAAMSAFSKLPAAAGAAFAAAGAAVAAAGAAFAAGLKDIVDYGGKLNDLSLRIGTSVENLVIQEQAFKDAGLGADSLAGAYGKLQNAIEGGFNGDSNVEKSFRSLGLSVEELINLDPGTQFERVSKVIGTLPTATERSAAALRLFGRGATELIPLFRSGGAFDEARATLGDLPALMQRNAAVLDGLSDAFGRIPAKLRGFFAGFINEMRPEIENLTKLINGISFSELGINFGAFVNVAKQHWADGNFAEFIGLSIGAGFELGMKKGKELIDWFTSTQVSNAIGNFSVSLVAGIGKAFIDLSQFFRGTWYGMMIYAGSSFVEMLNTALNFFSQKLEWVINAAIGLMKKTNFLMGQLLPDSVSLPKAQNMESDFGKSLASGMALANVEGGMLKSTIEKLVDKYREFFGIASNSDQSPESNLEKLNRLMREQLQLTEKTTEATRELFITGTREREASGGDGKWAQESMTNRLSIQKQMANSIQELDQQFGTLAEKIARVFKGITTSAVEGVAGSIRGLLTLTMSWGEALRNIGSSILNGVINAIAQMFAEMLVQMTLVQGLKRIFHAEDKVQAGLTAATWAPAAATTNAATGGAFASIGIPLTLGLILAAVGTIAALAFADGGLTPGKPTLAMVGERGPELVLPAHVTSMLTQSQRSSLVAGNFSAVPQTQGASGKTQRIIIVSDDRKLKDLESDPAFENVVVRVNERNKWRFA